MKALFAFTIGPVKAFIENSRKMSDLYGGSSILSELTRKAIVEIRNNGYKGYDVIFPVIDEDERGSNIPNRFIARINNFNVNNFNYYKQTAEYLTKAVTDAFKEMCLDSLTSVGITDKKEVAVAIKQVADFLEVHWLYQEYESDADYREAYNAIFKGLQAVKNIRPFAQSNEFWGRKCTLFPEYNAVVIKKDTKGDYSTHINKSELVNYIDISENQKLTHIVKPKEALSVIALFKRVHVKDWKMKSLRCMLLEVYYNEITHYVEYNVTTNATYIADAIYDLSNNNEPTTDEYPQKLIEIAKKIYDVIKNTRVFLSSYYACIKFDGDNMGDEYRRIANETEHQDLSEKISKFAKQAKKIVEGKYGGLCVYAGGEDVLAFLPICTLFSGLQELHKAFFDKTQLTFSAGVAIAHLMQPLKEVLITAEKMEQYAKQTDKKNAYALTLLKRSGELRTVRHKFNYGDDKDYKTLNIINEMIHTLAREKCSKSLIYDVINTLNALVDKPEDKTEDAMVQTIIGQIFKQKRIEGTKLLQKFYELWASCTCLQDYIDCLDIVGFLSKEVFTHVPN